MDNKINMVKIDFSVGTDIDKAYNKLKTCSLRYNCDTYADFNGKQIDSTMTIDQVYQSVLGTTKAESDKYKKEWLEEYEQKERKHKASIPEKTREYIKRGHELFDMTLWDSWDKCVPIRLKDLYHGMELDCTLTLVKMLDKDNCSIEDATKVFNEQGHSGMSASLMFSMMRTFCKHGNEFVEANK